MKGVDKLTTEIESALSSQFGYDAKAVVFTHKSYADELNSLPATWGQDETRKHNALFLLEQLKPADVMSQLPAPVEKYEQVILAKSTIFWSASKDDLGKTTIMKLAGLPIYKKMTVRNHRTTFKLLELLNH